MLDRYAKCGAEGYPPYNIEEMASGRYKITLSVAGFTIEDLTVLAEDRHLTIRGEHKDPVNGRVYLHRGIARRRFQRVFAMTDPFEVEEAALARGLLSIVLRRMRADAAAKAIPINSL